MAMKALVPRQVMKYWSWMRVLLQVAQSALKQGRTGDHMERALRRASRCCQYRERLCATIPIAQGSLLQKWRDERRTI
jgi:queuine/archaeosine tRNA-ribosyltransferase